MSDTSDFVWVVGVDAIGNLWVHKGVFDREWLVCCQDYRGIHGRENHWSGYMEIIPARHSDAYPDGWVAMILRGQDMDPHDQLLPDDGGREDPVSDLGYQDLENFRNSPTLFWVEGLSRHGWVCVSSEFAKVLSQAFHNNPDHDWIYVVLRGPSPLSGPEEDL